MDDFQIFIYVILVVLYIVSRLLKAKKAATPPPSQNPGKSLRDIMETKSFPPSSGNPSPSSPYSGENQSKPITFEDLLKEFSGYQEPPKKEETTYETLEQIGEEETKEEAQSYESLDSYESQRSESTFSYESEPSYDESYPARGELKPSADIQATLKKAKRFEHYAILESYDVHNASRFRKLLQNNVSVKDAVILKEILDRRHF